MEEGLAVSFARERAMFNKVGRFFGSIAVVAFFVWLSSLSLLSSGPDYGFIALVISGLSLLIAAISTVSGTMLGWRTDRRQSAEYKLKIEQLELQVAEAKKKAEEQTKISN
jgi:uncharacterized membrane protein